MNPEPMDEWTFRARTWLLRKRIECSIIQRWMSTLINDLIPARQTNMLEASTPQEEAFFRSQIVKIEEQEQRLRQVLVDLTTIADAVEHGIDENNWSQCNVLMQQDHGECAMLEYLFHLDTA